MINGTLLLWASALGTALQLAMVTTGHQVIQVKVLFLWSGLLFSAVAGALYARVSRESWSHDLIAGGVDMSEIAPERLQAHFRRNAGHLAVTGTRSTSPPEYLIMQFCEG